MHLIEALIMIRMKLLIIITNGWLIYERINEHY